MLIPVCYEMLLVQWDWNVVLMTLHPCRHSFLPDPGATSGQSPFLLSFLLLSFPSFPSFLSSSNFFFPTLFPFK